MAGAILNFLERFRRHKSVGEEAKPYTIEDGWRDHFAPVVRGAGFNGSRRHFRRIVGEFVQVINLQGSRYGGRFAVNLGLQPLAIPDILGRPVDPRTIKEVECVFRRRLSEESVDQWWDYVPGDRASIEKAARAAAQAFECKGTHLFDEFGGADSPILTITADEFKSGGRSFFGGISLPLTALALSRLRKAQGSTGESAAFAKLGLQGASADFRGRAELEALSSLSSSLEADC